MKTLQSRLTAELEAAQAQARSEITAVHEQLQVIKAKHRSALAYLAATRAPDGAVGPATSRSLAGEAGGRPANYFI